MQILSLKKRRSRGKKIQEEFQDGRALDPELSRKIYNVCSRLLCAISTHTVCLDVDHRLLLVIGERSSRPMKEFLRVRCKWGMEREWQREWTDLLSRSIQALEICNTLCLLWTARAHDVITRLMNEFLRSLFYIHIYIWEYCLLDY